MAAESKKLEEITERLLDSIYPFGLMAPPLRRDVRKALQSAYALGQQDFNEELLELLKRALEELRLIRVKYYDAVFDHGIRSGISIAIERASALHREQ
jgi:hypothetical protein